MNQGVGIRELSGGEKFSPGEINCICFMKDGVQLDMHRTEILIIINRDTHRSVRQVVQINNFLNGIMERVVKSEKCESMKV